MNRICLSLILGLICWPGVDAAWADDEPTKGDVQEDTLLFDQLDANHDGQVSRDEIPQDKQTLFDRMLSSGDRDKNGLLSRDEFAAGLELRRPKRAVDEKLPADFGGLPQPAAADEMFRRLDRNSDGKVVADEVPDEFRQRFDQFAAIADKDNDGAITQEELRQALDRIRQQFAGKPGELEPARVFEYLDRNADGKLTADEIPSERKPMFERAMRFGDRDGDGALSEEEFTKIATAWRQRQKQEESGAQPSAADPPTKKNKNKKKKKDKNSPGSRLTHHLLRLDSDHDGKVSLTEFSGQEKKRFARIDANQDGFLDQSEIEQFAAMHAAKMGEARPKGDPRKSNP